MLSKRILFFSVIFSLSTTAYATTIIGIAGGTASGKTTLARKIKERFPNDVTVISQDNYYKPVQKELTKEEHSKLNFDVPEAIDFSLLKSHILALKQGKTIPQLSYNFVTLKTVENGTIKPNKVIIIEGMLLFTSEEVRNEFDLKIFVDADNDIRFARRIEYYQKAYGFTRDHLIEQYFATVKPGHDAYIKPTKLYADIVIPSHKDTSKAEDVITTFITSCIKTFLLKASE